MQKKASLFPIFILLIFLSTIIFFFSKNEMFKGVGGVFEQAVMPLQRLTFSLFHMGGGQSSEQMLRQENADLLGQLAKQKEIEKENRALHDQFQITNPAPKTLLPASIIGRGTAEFIIDKGEKDNVKTGQVVIFKTSVVGIITKVSASRAVIRSVAHQNTSFTAQAVKTGALGVIYGRGEDDVIFGNVVQSDKLEKDDLVTTRGDIDSNGRGFPPDLIVGKIVSINKRASSLFQTAEIKSLVDFSKLETVFIMVGE